MAVTFNNTQFDAGDSAVGATVGSQFVGANLLSGAAPISINGTINNPGDTVQIDVNLASGPLVGATGEYIGFSTIGSDFGYVFNVTAAGLQTPVTVVVTGAPGGIPTTLGLANFPVNTNAVPAPIGPNTPCFTTGTRITTARGEIAVEDLRVGDRVLTATGAFRPVEWIGHRVVEGAGRVLPHDYQPVRVAAGAFGGGLPARDLRLSPGHPVLVGADADNQGGHLVPIMCLINGTSIVRESVTEVTYWHVELDAHDVLLAEGLPAESYLDWGDRPYFDESSDHALHNPDFVVPGLSARCRPVAIDGSVVEAERVRLSAVFAAGLDAHCGWDANLLDTLAA